jgi:hypothetical protein
MTVSIPPVANNNTFLFWKTQTNFLANAMSTVVVTVNSNTAVGNAAITGTFTSNNVVVNTTATLNRISANGSVGSTGQVLTSNGSSSYWSTIVGTITQINTADGVKGGPINSVGTISLDLYTGSDAQNVNYPVGTIVSVYTGVNQQRAVSSVSTIYTNNLQGVEGISGLPLTGTWVNRGLSGTDYRSESEIRYYYLYQRVV